MVKYPANLAAAAEFFFRDGGKYPARLAAAAESRLRRGYGSPAFRGGGRKRPISHVCRTALPRRLVQGIAGAEPCERSVGSDIPCRVVKNYMHFSRTWNLSPLAEKSGQSMPLSHLALFAGS